MLNVSRLIAVARGARDAREVRRSAPDRFEGGELPAPVVVWNICRHCNMSCPHCYAAATEKPSRYDLSTEQALEFIAQMDASGVGVVIFSGGEPLMRPDVFRLIREATDRGLSAHLSSNGSQIDPSVAEKLAELGVGYVGVSVDGLPSFNDEYRGLEMGFHRAVEGVCLAMEAGMRGGLRMTLTRRNIDHLFPLIDYATGLGVDRFYVSHLLYSGRGYAIAEDDLTPDHARAALLALFERADRQIDKQKGPEIVTGGNDSDAALLVKWMEMRFGEEEAGRVRTLLERRGGNSAGVKLLNVDARGEVHPDQFWQSKSLGNVKRDSWATILEHPFRHVLTDRISMLDEKCQQCPYVRVCGGSHRERAEAATGDMWAPDPACVMNDEEVQP